MKIKYFSLIFFITAVGALFRFYSLNCGAPFFFHPDERNIASSVTQLNFPDQMNPHFFAYGSLPIYIIYFTNLLLNTFFNFKLSFPDAILISRFYSALFSVLLIPSAYLIGKEIKDRRTGLLFSFLTATSVGFMQFSHFGTFEVWTSFELVWLFYFCLKLIKNNRLSSYFFIGIFSGLLISTKISNLPFLSLPVFSLVFFLLKEKNEENCQKRNQIKLIFLKILFYLIICSLIFLLLSPFAVIDFSSFISSLKYESAVALGTLPVFYTGQFTNTIPVYFQFLFIYPFLINPLLALIFIPMFIYVLCKGFKNKNFSYLILILSYLIAFLSQAFLFTKWTRYIMPSLPFIYLIISIGIIDFLKGKAAFGFKIIILSFSFIYFLISFITIFFNEDTRITASKWANKNIPRDARILSEVYDLGITPFNPYFQNITLFNFYDLENNPSFGGKSLPYSFLDQTDYIIIPSQRLLRGRLSHPSEFPKGYNFYKNLFYGNLRFKKIYETPCNILCKITYMGNPVFNIEETVNVFDRPTLFIFKKQ